MTRRQTLQLKRAFLDAFRQHGNVTKACEQAAVASRQSVYQWQEHDPEFAIAFRLAEVEATERLEAEAHRRAVEGTDKPVYQGGRRVGTVREHSDTLLIFLLKARAPEKYRDRVDVRHSGEVSTSDHLTPDERQRIRAALTGTGSG